MEVSQDDGSGSSTPGEKEGKEVEIQLKREKVRGLGSVIFVDLIAFVLGCLLTLGLALLLRILFQPRSRLALLLVRSGPLLMIGAAAGVGLLVQFDNPVRREVDSSKLIKHWTPLDLHKPKTATRKPAVAPPAAGIPGAAAPPDPCLTPENADKPFKRLFCKLDVEREAAAEPQNPFASLMTQLRMKEAGGLESATGTLADAPTIKETGGGMPAAGAGGAEGDVAELAGRLDAGAPDGGLAPIGLGGPAPGEQVAMADAGAIPTTDAGTTATLDTGGDGEDLGADHAQQPAGTQVAGAQGAAGTGPHSPEGRRLGEPDGGQGQAGAQSASLQMEPGEAGKKPAAKSSSKRPAPGPIERWITDPMTRRVIDAFFGGLLTAAFGILLFQLILLVYRKEESTT